MMTWNNNNNHINKTTPNNISFVLLLVVATTTATAASIATLLVLRYHNKKKYNGEEDEDEDENDHSKIPSSLLKSPFAKELQLAVQLAKKAGNNMKPYLESKGTVNESSHDIIVKGGAADFCTKVDIDNEHLIMQGIQNAFPNHSIVGEETVGTGTVPKIKDISNPTWIIDPIDGTTNFSIGLHMTCVSIGYCPNHDHGGIPVMGVIYAPATNEWYMAIRGYGAYRNGKRILVPPQSRTKALCKAVVCAEFGYSRSEQEIDIMVGAVRKILNVGCKAIRQLGSGCLDLCYVATGILDVVYAGLANEGWKPWDYAAALVICQESGCIFESIHNIEKDNGGNFDLNSNTILCGASRELVDECRELLLQK